MIFTKEVEIDEGYFGARRARGKSGCGASRKIQVADLGKPGGRVYVKIVNDFSGGSLPASIKGFGS